MIRHTLLLTVCSLALPISFSHAADAPANTLKPGERGVVSFDKSAPQIEADQLRMRIHASDKIPAYDVKNESFEVLLPKSYTAPVPHGLFIWISASNAPSIPKEWEPVLAEKKLIFIGAKNSGNSRDIFDRFRLAVDANANARALWNIDGRRVYVSGFSGGSRVASMLGVAFGEMFSGAACFMGVNFYEDVKGDDGKLYGLNYIPDADVLALAKKFCRYALITGGKDFNRPNTRAAFDQGFKKQGFANVTLIDIPGHGHSPPAAEWLRKALDYLDEGKP